MGIAEIIATGLALANAGTELLMKSGAISILVNRMQSENRTEITKEEWDAVIAMDDAARKKLDDAIKAAGG